MNAKRERLKQLRSQLQAEKKLQIQEQYAFEEQLKKEKVFSDTIFNSLPFMIIATDGDYIVLANEKTASFYNKSIEEIRSRLDLTPSDEANNESKVIQQGETVEEFYAVDGRKVMIHKLQRLQHVPYCKNSLVFGIWEDITMQVNMEHALGRAREKIEETKQFKEPFLGERTSEFKKPMNQVLESIRNLLESSPLTEEQTQYCELMYHSAQNLLSTLKHFIGKKLEINSLFNLSTILNIVTNALLPEALSKNISLVCKPYPEGLPHSFFGEHNHIFQILFTIVENAIKFTDRGGVCISISFVKHNGNFFVTIAVEDSGIGMKTTELSRLFLNNSSIIRGTGLLFARDLIESMGGTISVSTCENKGSIFYLHFPLREYSAPGQTKPFEGKTALLVEDNALNLETGSKILKMFGFEVDVARDGTEGLNKAQSTHYDVILMDVYLPHQVSGVQVTKELRNSAKYPQIIIALTAMPESLEQECLKYDLTLQAFNGFIVKPFSPETFLAVLKKCFDSNSN